jgi:hypothetical protein
VRDNYARGTQSAINRPYRQPVSGLSVEALRCTIGECSPRNSTIIAQKQQAICYSNSGREMSRLTWDRIGIIHGMAFSIHRLVPVFSHEGTCV